MDLTTVFCNIDDFIKELSVIYQSLLGKNGKRGYERALSLSEIMTILVYYHLSGFKNFKSYYLYLRVHCKSEFPGLVSYSRFISLIPDALIPLSFYLQTKKGKATASNFIDSTPIRVCHNKRIKRNRVFKGIARRGKGSMGWFYGFKLHIIVNEVGELLSFVLTKGNVDDRVPVHHLCRDFIGKIYADKGYIGKALFEKLYKNGIHLVTGIKSNMKNHLMPLMDKIMLRKRSVIETINDQLKNICDIEHTRHRSPVNFMVNMISGLIAYALSPKKPAIRGVRGNLIAI